MGPITNNPHLIVILGQTASGKSALAMDLAQRFDGEIIAADSRTVYKGMDIGTAKPTEEDRRQVRHHLIDVVAPGEPFSVADFQRLAKKAINDIAMRGKVPILVGGSGLYIDSVIYDFSFRRPADELRRKELNELSVLELQDLLAERGIGLPENKLNPRHLIRALETGGEVPRKADLRPNTLVIGLDKDRGELKEVIVRRVERMINEGFIEEVRHLTESYGLDAPGMQTPGYREFAKYLAGQYSIEQAKQQFVRLHLQYSKRQKTWFKRNPDIIWLRNSEEAVDLATTFLNK